jgi:bifunctional non-homologous end joining protein LigD
MQPMLATLVKEPFGHPDWLFEVKWDSYRAIARFGKAIALFQNLLSLNQKFLRLQTR